MFYIYITILFNLILDTNKINYSKIIPKENILLFSKFNYFILFLLFFIRIYNSGDM